MTIEAVYIVLSLVNAGIGGIQGKCVVVVALIVFEIREEWQEPSAVFILTE
jgi:hypothetical protein